MTLLNIYITYVIMGIVIHNLATILTTYNITKLDKQIRLDFTNYLTLTYTVLTAILFFSHFWLFITIRLYSDNYYENINTVINNYPSHLKKVDIFTDKQTI